MIRRLVLLLLALFAPFSVLRAEPVELTVMSFNVWYGGEQVDIHAVARAIRAADADIVGLQETDGNLLRIAELAGYSHVDERRRILSRYPIFASGSGRREASGRAPYSITGLDPDALHAWVMVRPGKVVAVANTHFSSDPSGLDATADGTESSAVIALEALRLTEAQALAPLGELAGRGVPVLLTGDFNAPSHLDWTEAAAKAGLIPYALDWPASRFLENIGLRDSWREVHSDPVASPGLTWTDGVPGRIDFILAGGPVTTISSRLVGEPDSAADIAITPYPSDHRAVVSTMRVELADSPPLISAAPRRIVSGDSILLRAYDPSGEWTAMITRHGETAPITGLRDVVQEWRGAVRLATLGLVPEDYDAVLLDGSGRELARSAFTIVARDAVPSVTVPERVKQDQPLPVAWRNTPGSARDWIGIYPAREPDLNAYTAFLYTEAEVHGDGSIDISGLSPGQYEARLLLDEGFEVLASAPFTVAEAGH